MNIDETGDVHLTNAKVVLYGEELQQEKLKNKWTQHFGSIPKDVQSRK